MVTHIPASPTHSTTSLNYSNANPVHPSNPSAYLYSSGASSSSSSSSRRQPSDSQSIRSSSSSRTATTSNPPSSYKHGWSRKRSSSRSSTRSTSSTLRPSDTQSTTRSIAPSQADSTSRRSSQQRHSSSSQSDAGRVHTSNSRQLDTRNDNVRSSARTSYDPPAREQPIKKQNNFPYFSQTGDVEILIADKRKRKVQMYLLHSMFLAQNSRWWAEQLNGPRDQEYERNASVSNIPGGVTSSRGVSSDTSRNHKRYELYWGDDFGTDSMNTIPILVRSRDDEDSTSFGDDTPPRPPPTRNKPAAPSSSVYRSLSSAGHSNQQYNPDISTYESDLLTAYDNLLRIIYNHAPLLDSTNPATAYVQCKHLLALASMYNCLSITGPRVEHHLLHFRSLLPQQIAKYPPSYLKLAYQARSRTLLNDALIHVVGSWPLHAPQLARGEVPSRLRDLVDDKVDELDEARAKVEAKLFRLTLTTSRGERVNPSNAWLEWLAVSLFRQWVAENTTPPPAGILKSSSSGTAASRSGRGSSMHASTQQSRSPQHSTDRVYRLLASSSPSAYLDHEELKRFLKMSQPASLYSRDTLKRFERRMDELKNLAREAVMPLTRNFLELDVGRDRHVALPYLTCTRMGDGDWEFLWGGS